MGLIFAVQEGEKGKKTHPNFRNQEIGMKINIIYKLEVCINQIILLSDGLRRGLPFDFSPKSLDVLAAFGNLLRNGLGPYKHRAKMS